MAKNKSRGQKQKNVFQVANNKPTKAKNKAQPVTTNLKKINVKNSDKTTTVNKVFTELQREVKSLSKGTVVEPEKLQQMSLGVRFSRRAIKMLLLRCSEEAVKM
ncbi:ribosomal biogenesis factor isoform X1 [Latimeria chalumnae]|uniref:ribosomal biogenesis factor isoform X1 n=1 Tax=Latimeria chalumnae TaxID=7897 RepID=UPI00313CA078